MGSLSTEGAKILVLAGSFAGLYLLSRWASRLNESNAAIPPPPPLAEAPRKTERQPSAPSNVVTIDRQPRFYGSERVDEEQLRPIRILQMYFSQFDFESGPNDPASFADELFVKLYNENTGYEWTTSFFVATADGVDAMLSQEHWDYAECNSVIFVQRYSGTVIRQAIMDLLANTREETGITKDTEA
jgi:hypothetical protein